jgi:YHS domain-containing protein
MKTRTAQIRIVLTLTILLLIALVTLTGCKKKSETAATSTEKAALVTTEQTVCPVMDGKINMNLYTEYKGKKVYFCCPACKDQFEAEPEKYIAKLPQFKEQ